MLNIMTYNEMSAHLRVCNSTFPREKFFLRTAKLKISKVFCKLIGDLQRQTCKYYLIKSQKLCDIQLITAILKLGNSKLHYNKQQG